MKIFKYPSLPLILCATIVLVIVTPTLYLAIVTEHTRKGREMTEADAMSPMEAAAPGPSERRESVSLFALPLLLVERMLVKAYNKLRQKEIESGDEVIW
jgi:hypothetical protein